MNFAKRAFLSLSRRAGKTLILFLVILILGNLIAATVAMRQAIDQAEALAKLTLGANVSIGLDDQKLMDAYEAGEDPLIEGLNAEMIENLGTRPEVKSFDYTLDVYLTSKTLENYTPPSNEDDALLRGGTIAGTTEGASIILSGIHYAPVQPIEEGKLNLMEGRVFTQQEIEQGALMGLVSDKLAEQNNLHVGDTIVVNNEIRDYSSTTPVARAETSSSSSDSPSEDEGSVVSSHDVVLEIIGIFSLASGSGESGTASSGSKAPSQDEWMKQMMESDTYNTVFVPIAVSQAEELFMMQENNKLYPEETGFKDNLYAPWYTPLYVLNSVDDLASFEEAAAAVMPPYFQVLSADSLFDQVAGSMKSIQGIVGIVLIASVIAALVIVSLVVVLFLRDRRKEFGIYLSLGVRKPAIIGQVLVEVLVVALIALGIALITGNLISGGISQELMQNQLLANQQNGGTYTVGTAGMMMGTISLDDVIASYNVGISVPYILTFLGLGIGVSVLSCIVPLLYVLRLKPKKILM